MLLPSTPPPAPQRRIKGQALAEEDLDHLRHGDGTPLPSLPHSPLPSPAPTPIYPPSPLPTQKSLPSSLPSSLPCAHPGSNPSSLWLLGEFIVGDELVVGWLSGELFIRELSVGFINIGVRGGGNLGSQGMLAALFLWWGGG